MSQWSRQEGRRAWSRVVRSRLEEGVSEYLRGKLDRERGDSVTADGLWICWLHGWWRHRAKKAPETGQGLSAEDVGKADANCFSLPCLRGRQGLGLPEFPLPGGHWPLHTLQASSPLSGLWCEEPKRIPSTFLVNIHYPARSQVCSVTCTVILLCICCAFSLTQT